MNPTRRDFLKKGVALAGASLLVPGRILGRIAPSQRITLGFIGVGSQGVSNNLATFLQQPDAQVLAVCDVFEDRANAAKEMVDQAYGNKDCQACRDFREILDRQDIDAVVISTPDHWHCLLSLMAIRSGKDVFCEKPTLTIAEGRAVAEAVRAHGTVFQTATEDRSIAIYHRMAELVRNGRIGRLQSIHVTLPSGQKYEDEASTPVPRGLDYDLWLGPAPWAPYTPHRCDMYHWRQIGDYSGGQLTDWGAHLIDTAQWANDTEHTGPVQVEGRGTFLDSLTYSTAIEYDLRYGYKNGVELFIKSGGATIRFEGTEGWVGNAGWRSPVEASSEKILNAVIGPEEIRLFTCPQGEHRNFLDCVKTRKDPYFPAEIGHRCSSVLHIGNIALRLGRKLRWDPDGEAFHKDDEANRMRSRAMREPWIF